MWSTITRGIDSVHHLCPCVRDFLNVMGVTIPDTDKLCTDQGHKYLGSIREHGATIPIKLDFGELGPTDILQNPESIVYADCPILELKGMLQTGPILIGSA